MYTKTITLAGTTFWFFDSLEAAKAFQKTVPGSLQFGLTVEWTRNIGARFFKPQAA